MSKNFVLINLKNIVLGDNIRVRHKKNEESALKKSIKEKNLITPILVSKIQPNLYRIKDGVRRFNIFKELSKTNKKFEKIKAIVY